MGFELKEKLKQMLSKYLEILEDRGLTEERGNGYWNCPFCHSGDKVKNTPAFHLTNNNTKYSCFSCGAKGDIFDLVEHMEGMKNTNFPKIYYKVLKMMESYINKEEDADDLFVYQEEKQEVKIEEDHTEYLKECHKDVILTEYFHGRGLSNDTIDRFNLGFDVKKNVVTIPYHPSSNNYIHRALWKCDNKYCKYGTELFNVAVLYGENNKPYAFVTEGQMDAVSLEEIGYPAVGISGVNDIDKLIKILHKKNTDKTLIIALDNDKAGRRAIGKLICEFAEQEIECNFVVSTLLNGEYKDMNEFLVADREGFQKSVEKVVKYVEV